MLTSTGSTTSTVCGGLATIHSLLRNGRSVLARTILRKNHATYEEFIVQMRQVLRLTWNTLVDGGYACFVLGRSRIHGVDYDNASMLEGVASDEGFEHVARLQRAIAPTRKSFNLSHARIKTEDIVVLRKT